MRMKRTISLILVLCMCAVLVPVKVAAATPTVYSQLDSRWSSHPYGYSNEAGTQPATIGSGGCGILSLVNAVFYLNGNFIDPIMLADWSVQNGHRVNGVGTAHTLYPAFSAAYGDIYGFSCTSSEGTSSWSTMTSHLQNGGVAIASINTLATNNGHLLVVADYDSSNSTYLVLDSYKSANRGTSSGYAWMTKSEFLNRMSCSKFILISNKDINHTTHNYIGDYQEDAHPHKMYKMCACGAKQYTGREGYVATCGICNPVAVSTTYNAVLPFRAYLKNDSTAYPYTSEQLETLSGGEIWASDECTISAVYTNGACKVTYLAGSSSKTAYTHLSNFVTSSSALSKQTATAKANTYIRASTDSTVYGYISAGDVIYSVGTSGSMTQVFYPTSNGYKLAWVSTSALTDPEPIPDPDPEPTPVSNNPQGWLDELSANVSGFYVRGWAFDADNLNAQLEIHLKSGNQTLGIIQANKERTDVHEKFSCGTHHGFDEIISLDPTISGVLSIEVWAINVGGGSDSYLGTRSVNINPDETPPVMSEPVISDVSSDGYTVSCTVTDNNAVSHVLFPTWTVLNDQDDLPVEWGVGTKNGDTYSYRVSTADHNNESGTYVTHIYAYDANGNCTTKAITVPVPAKDSVAPVITEAHVYNITTDGYTVSCKVTDNMGIDRVQFPTWTATNGQDDLANGWQTSEAVSGTKNGDYYTFRVSAADHNNETTGYVTHIYAYDADGNCTTVNLSQRDLATSADTQAPVISDVQITEFSAFGYTVVCTVTDNQKVNRVQMPTWTSANGQDDIQANWTIAAAVRAKADGTTYTFRVNATAHNCEGGIYATDIYAYDDAGNAARVRVNDVLGDMVVPENLPLAEGLKDDFYAAIENNASRTVLTSTDDVVFSANENLDTQLWHFVKNDDGTYFIYSAADETHVLDIHLGLDSTDANVQLCAYNGSVAQRWYVHSYGGLYYLRPACSKKLLLDLPYASSANGVAAKINNPNQGGGEGYNLVGDILQTFTVSYDANGGDNAPASQVKTVGQDLWLSDQLPTREGYTFLGWAVDSAAEIAVYMPGEIYSEDADLTLYAVWAAQTEILATGWSGDTQWTLTNDGVLTFYGEGAMKTYEYKSEMPWYSYMDQITDVVIEEGVTSIGAYAFYGFDIESIEIPETVTSIGDYAFKNAAMLDNVVLPDRLTSLGDSAFYACTSLTHIEIPASLWTIKPYTFKNCTALTSVTIPEGNLEKISDGAFYGTALTELVLPDCLDILDVYAFKGCDKLASITIGSGLTEIREAAFYGTAIPTITIPEGITKIGPYAFKNCVKLETVDFPSTLTSVGEASFYACTALKTVELPDAVTTIGNYAFRKCAAIETLTFGSELVTIGECSFYGCTGLTELVIPDKVTTIKPYAFKTCSGLTSVTLGSSVETIGEGAFNTCTGLKTIVFPASLTSIGSYCFANSGNLWKLTFQGDAPSIGEGAFKGLNAYAYYPGGNATWTADNMLNYGGKITWKAK